MDIVLTDIDILETELLANTLRQDVIKMLVNAQSGHTAGPLGMAEVFASLYSKVLDLYPKDPTNDQRDRLILSNGHICAVQYAAMARTGFFPVEELMTFRRINSRLQGHPHNISLPGVENSGGPLGQGLSQAVGRALVAKREGKHHRVYCITSDGEHDEGQAWEAMMFAGNHNLNNLVFLLDRNDIQIGGKTSEVMPLEPLEDKYKAFNLHTIEIDGHNIREIVGACSEATSVHDKPTMIICLTTPGKGVDFMENDHGWHGMPPSPEEGEEALKQLLGEREKVQAKLGQMGKK